MIFVAIISVCGKEIPKSIAMNASEIGNVFSQCREQNDPFIYYLDGAVKHTNAIARTTSRRFFKPSRRPSRAHIFRLRWTSRRSSRAWCVDSHAIVAAVVASHVACLIALALVCFALQHKWLNSTHAMVIKITAVTSDTNIENSQTTKALTLTISHTINLSRLWLQNWR